MNITYISPTSNTTTNTPKTITSTMQNNISISILSNNDRNFIEFTRCLYKAKSVVQELQAFSNTVKPTLSPYQGNSSRKATDEFIQHVNQYLEGSFRKFNHMCKILLVVLTKLESNQPVRRERIESFRQEVVLEWRKAIYVRRELLSLLQMKQDFRIIPSPESSTCNNLDSSNSSSSSNSSHGDSSHGDSSSELIESDDDDTTPEPTSFDSSSS
ncbi:unnamed protein product [Mucor hiemalis]